MSHARFSPSEPLVITGCGVLSSLGIGLEAFLSALQQEKTGRTSIVDVFAEPMPFDEACYISEFDGRTFLGKKGTSFFDRLTALTIYTCGMALEQAKLPGTEQNRDRIGIVLGSSVGSLHSIGEFTRQTLINERPYLVNPVFFPNAVMNCAAGQTAIWHALKNINSTVSNGQLSSLVSLRYSMIALRQGYADLLVCGGSEELSPYMAWWNPQAQTLAEAPTLVGEGCALFVLEKASTAEAEGRAPLLEVLACEVGTCAEPSFAPEATTKGLEECIRRGLQRAGIAPHAAWVHSGSFCGDPVLDRVEQEGVRRALGAEPAVRLAIKQAVGECYSAAGALQLAALLSARTHDQGQSEGHVGLVTSVDHDGSVGCVLVKVL